MEIIPKKLITKQREWLSLKVALIYILLGSSWIYFSDKLMGTLAVDPQSAVRISLIKGLTYILVTAAPLFFIIHRGVLRIQRSEETIRETTTRLDNTLESISDAFFSMDDNLIVTYFNAAAERMLNRKATEVIGKYLFDAFPEARGSIFDEKYHYAVAEKVSVAFEAYFDIDPYSNWYNVRVYPQENGISVYFQIITERKRVEAAARTEKEKYWLLVRQVPGIVFKGYADYGLDCFDDKIETLTGYTQDEFNSRAVKWNDVLLEEYQAPVREQLKKAIKDDGFYVSEFRIRKKSGELVWVQARNQVVENAPGRMDYISGVFFDITERKLAEEALRESEELYRTLVSLSPDAISVADPNGLLTLTSPKARQIFGDSPDDEILGSNILSWVVPEEQEKASANIRHLLTEGTLIATEFTLLKKDGTRFIGEVNAAVIHSPDGSPMRIIIITRDITERKRAEEERRRLEDRLQRAEKMEALGTLAGGVAHDLNNVLGIVVGYSELLLLNDSDESGPVRSKAMEILKGGQRAAAIVQDLLTMARRGVTNRQVLNLNNIVVECRKAPEFAGISSYHPNIRLRTDLEAHLLNISGSAVHLSKSLLNLVSNAAEAMPEGGAITIKTRNQYLDKPVSGYDEVREGDYAVLTVSDTGGGIPAGDLKRIFEPFYTKKVMGRSGTGLGLAVVWGTVKDHSGYINVESQEGEGTIFTLYFPVTREEISQEQVSISAAEYIGNGESVLIVDDVKEQRELAVTMLKKLNYTVVTVSSGEEAVEYLKQNAVDLIVLDMIMDPGMDGLDTYVKILEIHPHQRAIIVSGFSETERVSRAKALGAGAYVKKPYVFEKLGLAVRKELDQPA